MKVKYTPKKLKMEVIVSKDTQLVYSTSTLRIIFYPYSGKVAITNRGKTKLQRKCNTRKAQKIIERLNSKIRKGVIYI